VDGPGVGRALADEGVTHLGAGPAGGAPEEPAAPALWSRAARAGEAGPGFRIRRVPVTLDAEREPAIVPEPAGHAAAPGRADLAA
jgi:hypothetical protein